MTYSLDSKFSFGKYSGQVVRDVIHIDASYIEWALNEEFLELDDEAMAYLNNIDDHFEPADIDYKDLLGY